jgi:hypothetical protein
VPKHEADPVPDFVIIGEADRPIFDFPQPEENSSSQSDRTEVNKISRTPTSASVQETQADSRQDKGKRQIDTNPANVANKKAITFTDAVGRKFSYPFHLRSIWAARIL